MWEQEHDGIICRYGRIIIRDESEMWAINSENKIIGTGECQTYQACKKVYENYWWT